MEKETKIGVVTHYFTNIGVAVFDMTDGALHVGDSIHVKGASTDLSQIVEEIQIDHKSIETAEMGTQIGVKMDDKVREGDDVFVVTMKQE